MSSPRAELHGGSSSGDELHDAALARVRDPRVAGWPQRACARACLLGLHACPGCFSSAIGAAGFARDHGCHDTSQASSSAQHPGCPFTSSAPPCPSLRRSTCTVKGRSLLAGLLRAHRLLCTQEESLACMLGAGSTDGTGAAPSVGPAASGMQAVLVARYHLASSLRCYVEAASPWKVHGAGACCRPSNAQLHLLAGRIRLHGPEAGSSVGHAGTCQPLFHNRSPFPAWLCSRCSCNKCSGARRHPGLRRGRSWRRCCTVPFGLLGMLC